MRGRIQPFLLAIVCTALGGCPSAWALGMGRPVPVSPIPVAEYFQPAKAGLKAAQVANFTPQLLQERWEAYRQNRDRAREPFCQNPYSAQHILDCQAPLDLGVVLQLNLRAVEVWEAMVSCQGGDAEAARLAYLSTQRLCSNPEENERVRGLLRAYSFQVDDFLLTSSFDFNLFQKSLKTPVLHPLLAELLIESVLSVRYLMQQFYRVSSFGIKLGNEYYMRTSRMEMEQFIDRCVRHRAEATSNPDEDKLGRSCSFDGKHAPDYWARLYRNAQRLLAADVNADESRGCARYGLWPNAAAIGSTGLGFFNGQSYTENDWGIPGRSSDPALPSCWENYGVLDRYLNGPWWGNGPGAFFPGETFEAKGRGDDSHMAMVVAAHETYFRLKQAWQKR